MARVKAELKAGGFTGKFAQARYAKREQFGSDRIAALRDVDPKQADRVEKLARDMTETSKFSGEGGIKMAIAGKKSGKERGAIARARVLADTLELFGEPPEVREALAQVLTQDLKPAKRRAKEAFEEAFEKLGGVDGLMAFACAFPDEYYKLFGRMLPTKIELDPSTKRMDDGRSLVNFGVLIERYALEEGAEGQAVQCPPAPAALLPGRPG